MGTTKQVNTQVVKTTVVDETTGEVLREELEHQTKISISEKEPSYVKLYLDDIAMLEGITANENNILLRILSITDYDNVVILNKYNRETKIMPYVNSKDTVIRNAISSFSKKNILMKISTGVYRVNPNLFGKGTWQNIKGLRLTIEYTEEGKTTQVEEIEK